MVLGSPRAVGALASGETADPSALHLPPSHPRLLYGKSPCQRSLPGRFYCHPLLISCLTSHLRLVAGVLSLTSCIDADSVWPPRLIPLPSPLNSASRRPESLRALLATATFELGSSALSDYPLPTFPKETYFAVARRCPRQTIGTVIRSLSLTVPVDDEPFGTVRLRLIMVY